MSNPPRDPLVEVAERMASVLCGCGLHEQHSIVVEKILPELRTFVEEREKDAIAALTASDADFGEKVAGQMNLLGRTRALAEAYSEQKHRARTAEASLAAARAEAADLKRERDKLREALDDFEERLRQVPVWARKTFQPDHPDEPGVAPVEESCMLRDCVDTRRTLAKLRCRDIRPDKQEPTYHPLAVAVTLTRLIRDHLKNCLRTIKGVDCPDLIHIVHEWAQKIAKEPPSAAPAEKSSKHTQQCTDNLVAGGREGYTGPRICICRPSERHAFVGCSYGPDHYDLYNPTHGTECHFIPFNKPACDKPASDPIHLCNMDASVGCTILDHVHQAP